MCQPGEQFRAHAGNQFIDVISDYQHLNTLADVKDQLSYFTVLSPPESGGELVLYDLLWKDTPEIFKLDRRPNSPQRHKIVEAKYKKLNYINPPKGAILIFAGGKIWHKVSPIQGSRNRVTLGGFLAHSRNKDVYYYWA